MAAVCVLCYSMSCCDDATGSHLGSASIVAGAVKGAEMVAAGGILEGEHTGTHVTQHPSGRLEGIQLVLLQGRTTHVHAYTVHCQWGRIHSALSNSGDREVVVVAVLVVVMVSDAAHIIGLLGLIATPCS